MTLRLFQQFDMHKILLLIRKIANTTSGGTSDIHWHFKGLISFP